ncbi:hypothetical protein Btru_063176, partial [Bulinus truncatus]
MACPIKTHRQGPLRHVIEFISATYASAPTVQELTSALEGANLKLACLTNSTSLPTDHGLKSAILWKNEQNQIIGETVPDKFILDADGHLEIKNIQRSDKGLRLTCTSSDIAEGITSSPESDPSQVYEVKPEFKPSVSDIVLKPPISGDDKVSKKESEDLTYTCDTTCDPACTVQWSFKSFSSPSFVPLLLADPKILKKTVQRADYGTYRCSATNKHGVASKDFELEVLYPKVSKDTVLKNVYTSVYSLSSVQSEDNGVYSCEVTNKVSTIEERINMVVLCPPTRADVDGLKLEPEYVWELSKSLTFSFVIKAFPEPNVIKVSSRIQNDIRNLDLNDKDRVFTMTFDTSESKGNLDFVIRPRGADDITLYTEVDQFAYASSASQEGHIYNSAREHYDTLSPATAPPLHPPPPTTLSTITHLPNETFAMCTRGRALSSDGAPSTATRAGTSFSDVYTTTFQVQTTESKKIMVTCDEPPGTLVTCDKPPETLVTCDEPPRTLVTCDEPPETFVTCDDPPETLVTCDEPPGTLLTCYEPPETLVIRVEPPETLLTHEESPEELVTRVEPPEELVTHEEPPETVCQDCVSRLTVTPSLAERKVYVDLKGVSSADAGMYKCYNGINYNNVIANCGQKLVIVRKPNKPTIQELTSVLEGANLKLACLTNSTSLPTDHGLKSAILWRNEQNHIFGVPGTDKLSMDADGHLEIKNIQRTDKGRKLTCTSSDIADGITSSPKSDQSQVYELKPEFKPSVSDIVLKPPISGDDKVSKKESEDLTYTCDTTCDPACTVQWSFKSFSSLSFVPLQLADPKTFNKTVQRADHGTYRCSATNKHGVGSVDFQLVILFPPNPVTMMSAVDINHDAVKIVWLTGYNGGGQQYFDVEYRKCHFYVTYSWNVAVKGIKDPEVSDMKIEAVMHHLEANTDYELRIISRNRLGSAESALYRLKTIDVPNACRIAGMAICATVVILIVVAVVAVAARHTKCKMVQLKITMMSKMFRQFQTDQSDAFYSAIQITSKTYPLFLDPLPPCYHVYRDDIIITNGIVKKEDLLFLTTCQVGHIYSSAREHYDTLAP